MQYSDIQYFNSMSFFDSLVFYELDSYLIFNTSAPTLKGGSEYQIVRIVFSIILC